MSILNQYIENGYKITEYTNDGVNVSSVFKVILSDESNETIESKPTLEQIAEENLLETKYQTLLLEMML